jgi:hypothetical protein
VSSPLVRAAADLTRAVDGRNWDVHRVDACTRALLAEVAAAPVSERVAALDVLVERLRSAHVEDADGVAHVAISGGTLVENGAPPRPLIEALLPALPDVLRAARRYADRCLASLPAETESDGTGDAEGDAEDANDFTEVDGRAIPLDVFRAHLEEDPAGGAALAYLDRWVLPTVAALTRDRDGLRRASGDGLLRQRTAAMARSDAHWLHLLLGVQLEATWLVLCPGEGRGFRVVVDGVVSNHDLHALLAAALIAHGVPGEANPPEVAAYLRGERDTCPHPYVVGSWNLYTCEAARFDLRDPRAVPHAHWVWGEGVPNDVPAVDGTRVLVIGPAAYRRTWSAGRPFLALQSRVDVIEDLSAAAVREHLARLAG